MANRKRTKLFGLEHTVRYMIDASVYAQNVLYKALRSFGGNMIISPHHYMPSSLRSITYRIKMRFSLSMLALSLASLQGTIAQIYLQPELNPRYILHEPDLKFENLAVRANGQILTTITQPNASIYQVDPDGKLPMTLIHFIGNDTSAAGIAEGAKDIFYVASGHINITDPFATVPSSYEITEIDVRGVHVLADGTLSKPPSTRLVASLPDAILLNGAAFSRKHSDTLLVADSFNGLIWSVNIDNGTIGVAFNDTTTKGTPALGPNYTGINGLRVQGDTMYWTSTGLSTLFKMAIDEYGHLQPGHSPVALASNITCDDFAVDRRGNVYVAGPLAVLTRVSARGEAEIIAGTFNSTSSDLGGPSSVRFGRTKEDRNTIYVTLNGGLLVKVPNSAGIVKLDIGELEQ